MTTQTTGRADPRPATVPRERSTVPVVPLLLTVLLLLLVLAGATLSSPWELSGGGRQEPLPLPAPTETVAPPPVPLPQEEPSELPTAARVALLVLTGLLATAIAAYLVYRAVRKARQTALARRSRPRTERSPGDTAGHGTVTVVPDLRTGVETATARLRGATSSTDAIIAAWLALEESAEASGAPRTAAQTPTELTVAVLETTHAPPETIERLLRLYHLARFTQTPLTPADVAAADDCLADLTRAFAHTPDGHRTHPTDLPSTEDTTR
ncbi:DUF4129 domain-containing protein [Sanguibacter sp. 25GB23B1]|uniref:DUF4129 domain-containing protein n=1 Tax=unclassified Sanguibacter TaxID=2645534 RepID=UPI0032AF7AD7